MEAERGIRGEKDKGVSSELRENELYIKQFHINLFGQKEKEKTF